MSRPLYDEVMREDPRHRWAVVRGDGHWLAASPFTPVADQHCPSQSEAFTYADARARDLWAAQDDELDGFAADAAAYDEANVDDALRERP